MIETDRTSNSGMAYTRVHVTFISVQAKELKPKTVFGMIGCTIISNTGDTLKTSRHGVYWLEAGDIVQGVLAQNFASKEIMIEMSQRSRRKTSPSSWYVGVQSIPIIPNARIKLKI